MTDVLPFLDRDALDETERDCIARLAELDREYRERCKPYVDALVRIRGMRPPPPLIITREQFAELTGIVQEQTK